MLLTLKDKYYIIRSAAECCLKDIQIILRKRITLTSSRKKLLRLVLSAMLLALALVLPLLTGQNRELGNALCLIHIPIILCGYFCGPWYALVIGLAAPYLRLLFFGMPPILLAFPMSLELAAYGFFSGLLYRLLPKKKPFIYISLISAMLIGRILWGAGKVILLGLGKIEFGWKLFLTGGFAAAVPGIIIQIVLIPILVMVLERYTDKIRG